MPMLKLTEGQLQKVKEDPMHYTINVYHVKDGYEVDCTPAEAKAIKKIVDN